MRGDDHVGIAEQRVVGDRLAPEHVERGAGHLARVDRRLEIRIDHQWPPGDVEHADAVPALGQHVSVQPVLGVGRLGQMQGDEVRRGVHVVG